MYSVTISSIENSEDFVELTLSNRVFNNIYYLLYKLFERILDNELFSRFSGWAQVAKDINLCDIPHNAFKQAVQVLEEDEYVSDYALIIELMKQDPRFSYFG